MSPPIKRVIMSRAAPEFGWGREKSWVRGLGHVSTPALPPAGCLVLTDHEPDFLLQKTEA